jgi:hypothetical protein
VLPCCHQRVAPTGLEAWMEWDVAQDVMRAHKLREFGYEVHTSLISSEITPKNRVLVGRCRA